MVKKMAVLNKSGQCVNVIMFDPEQNYHADEGFHLAEYNGQVMLTQDEIEQVNTPNELTPTMVKRFKSLFG